MCVALLNRIFAKNVFQLLHEKKQSFLVDGGRKQQYLASQRANKQESSNILKTMTYVVTGCGGQLGSNVFFQLSQALHGGSTAPPLDHRPIQRLVGIVSNSTPMSACSAETKRSANEILFCGDLTDEKTVQAIFEKFAPISVVIHCAAITAVNDAYQRPEQTKMLNVDATAMLGKYAASQQPSGDSSTCTAANIPPPCLFVHISTDMVFSGEAATQPNGLYVETAIPSPLSAYGRSKLQSERAALSPSSPLTTLVVRVPLMFGVPLSLSRLQSNPGTFLSQIKSLLLNPAALKGFHDETRTPISFWQAAESILKLLSKDVSTRIFADVADFLRNRQENMIIDAGKQDSAASAAATTDHSKDPRIVHVAGPQRYTRLTMLKAMHDVITSHYRQKDDASSMYNELRRAAANQRRGASNEDATAAAAVNANSPPPPIESVSRNDFPAPEPRPADLSLSIAKYRSLIGGGKVDTRDDEDFFRAAVETELLRWIEVTK